MKEDKKNRVFLKILKCFVVLLLTVLAFVAVLATCSAKWALKTWNHLTADELVFHLRAPLEGTNQAMIDEFIKNCAEAVHSIENGTANQRAAEYLFRFQS